MEKNEAAQPQKGTWEKLTTDVYEKKPSVNFEINLPRELVFISDQPREQPSKEGNGVFYIWDVEENKEPKVVMTSAWSLLRGLKIFGGLAGKKLQITKKTEKTKQFFEVKEVK